MLMCRIGVSGGKRPDDRPGTCSLEGPCGRARHPRSRSLRSRGSPLFRSTRLTSVAYGPEAIIVVLALAGAGALHLILPITVAIVVLLAILVFSYRQVIDAYPGGGGAYAVSRANFGPAPPRGRRSADRRLHAHCCRVDRRRSRGADVRRSQALLRPPFRICLGILAVITLLNLRGLGEAARAFLLPTMLFIVGLLAIIAIGLVHPLGLNAPQPGHSLLPTQGLQVVACFWC